MMFNDLTMSGFAFQAAGSKHLKALSADCFKSVFWTFISCFLITWVVMLACIRWRIVWAMGDSFIWSCCYLHIYSLTLTLTGVSIHSVIFNLSDQFDLDFQGFYGCVGLFTCMFLIIFSIFDLSILMQFSTR